MGGKHLKNLRAEKSKVKLRKKSLPKGQNITDTTFKVKKIVTIEQLKKLDGTEPVTSWNLPLKDLLIRLGHYNQTAKLNSLSGIKELVTKHPGILRGPSLKQLITRILELLTDDEHRVRKNAVDLIQFLLECLSTASIIPFHDTLNVHLGCAMTHRSLAIQRDSLKFIDVMIKHTPEAIKSNFKSLLPNFIRIIKSYLYRTTSEVTSTEINFEKSRSEMLSRFYQILAVVYSVQKDDLSGIKPIEVNCNQLISLRGLTNFYKKNPDLSALFKSNGMREEISEFVEEEFKEQCMVIMPLLFDIWLESCPEQKSSKFVTECVINKPTADLLHIILKIIMLLYKKTLKSGHPGLEPWFVSSYTAVFKKCFLFGFPYLPSVSSEKSDDNLCSGFLYEKFNGYLLQNLIICYLVYALKVPLNNVISKKIDSYISNALTAKIPTSVDIFSNIVEAVFKSPKRSDFLSAAVQVFNNSNSPELQDMLSKVLTAVILERDVLVCGIDKNFLEWITSFPEELLKPQVSSYIIKSILAMIKVPTGSTILAKVEQKAEGILKNLPKIKIEGIDQSEGQKLIAEILYWCNEKVLIKIHNILLETDSFPLNLKSYMTNIFSYKLSN